MPHEFCGENTSEYDFIFNGNRRQLLFLKGRECVSSNLYISVC